MWGEKKAFLAAETQCSPQEQPQKWFWSGGKGSWKERRQCEKFQGHHKHAKPKAMLSKPTFLHSQEDITIFSSLAAPGWQSSTQPKTEPLQSLHAPQLLSCRLHRDGNMHSHIPHASRVQVGHREGQRAMPSPKCLCTQVPHPAEVTLRTTYFSQSSPLSAQPGIFAYPNHSCSTVTWNVQALHPQNAS